MADEYTERGFAVFARVEIGGDGYDPIIDFTVQESSLATERRVWVGKGEHRGHLTEQQARAVRDALSEFLGDEPEAALLSKVRSTGRVTMDDLIVLYARGCDIRPVVDSIREGINQVVTLDRLLEALGLDSGEVTP